MGSRTPWGFSNAWPEYSGRGWCLGHANLIIEMRPILRGSLEFRYGQTIAPRLPRKLILFLASVAGTRDYITRERHGHWGYHYHYLDSSKRRSDTLLTFDQASIPPAPPRLCWERHAEGDKFQARAGRWGTAKRQNVYSVCFPDTLRWSLSEFKRPGAGASTVWP